MSIKKILYVFAGLCVLVLSTIAYAWNQSRVDSKRFWNAQSVRELLAYRELGLHEDSCLRDYIRGGAAFREFVEEFDDALAANPSGYELFITANADNDMLLPVIATELNNEEFAEKDSFVQIMQESGVNIFDSRCYGKGDLIYNAVAGGKLLWLESLLTYYSADVEREYHFVEYAIIFCATDSLNVLLHKGVLIILCQFFNLQHNAVWRIDYDRTIRFQ